MTYLEPYDAQITGLKLMSNGTNMYGIFTEESRLAIYGTGPHGAGSIISYSIRIKTTNGTHIILVHYGHMFGTRNSPKNFYTLTLENGTPKLYANVNSVLEPQQTLTLNDGKWHDIAVSMPRKSCALSEIIMYVDRHVIETIVPQNDEYIFFITSGRMSIGGFGYSHKSFEKMLPHLKPYTGYMDDFYIWGRSIEDDDLK